MMHDITVTNRESVYTGTMDLAIEMGKVTGKMVVTAPRRSPATWLVLRRTAT